MRKNILIFLIIMIIVTTSGCLDNNKDEKKFSITKSEMSINNVSYFKQLTKNIIVYRGFKWNDNIFESSLYIINDGENIKLIDFLNPSLGFLDCTYDEKNEVIHIFYQYYNETDFWICHQYGKVGEIGSPQIIFRGKIEYHLWSGYKYIYRDPEAIIDEKGNLYLFIIKDIEEHLIRSQLFVMVKEDCWTDLTLIDGSTSFSTVLDRNGDVRLFNMNYTSYCGYEFVMNNWKKFSINSETHNRSSLLYADNYSINDFILIYWFNDGYGTKFYMEIMNNNTSKYYKEILDYDEVNKERVKGVYYLTSYYYDNKINIYFSDELYYIYNTVFKYEVLILD